MSKPRKQGKREYGFLAFRPTPLLDHRLRTLSDQTGQSVGAIIRECVSAHLSVLERAGKEAGK